MNRLTKKEKREFVWRCKLLAQSDGKREEHERGRHNKWRLFIEHRLMLVWNADLDYLLVKIMLPGNEAWTTVVTERYGQLHWEYDNHDFIDYYLQIMRQKMVLDDLADV